MFHNVIHGAEQKVSTGETEFLLDDFNVAHEVRENLLHELAVHSRNFFLTRSVCSN